MIIDTVWNKLAFEKKKNKMRSFWANVSSLELSMAWGSWNLLLLDYNK